MSIKKTIKTKFSSLYSRLDLLPEPTRSEKLDEFFILQQIGLKMADDMIEMKKTMDLINKLPNVHLFSQDPMYVDGLQAMQDYLTKMQKYYG